MAPSSSTVVGSFVAVVASIASHDWTVAAEELTTSTRMRCDVRRFGAVGDGVADDTRAVQAALNDGTCSHAYVSPGNYTVRPLRVELNDLYLAYGSVLMAWPTPDGYATIDVEVGKKATKPRLAPIISINRPGRAITGSGGMIDGRGAEFWYAQHARARAVKPPRTISLADVEDVKINNINIVDSPFWTIHVFRSKRVHIHDITIKNVNAAHTDGIDVDSSEETLIERVHIAARDDVVAYKATDPQRPSIRHILRDSTFYGDFGRGGAIAVGSEVQGGISDVLVSNCSVSRASAAVLIKTKPQRGGFILNVKFTQINVMESHRAIFFDTNYTATSSHRKCGHRKVTHDPSHSCPRIAMERLGFVQNGTSRTRRARIAREGPPAVKTLIANISFEDFDIDTSYVGFRSAGTLVGSGDVPLLGLHFSDLSVIRASSIVNTDFFDTLGFHCCCAFGTILSSSSSVSRSLSSPLLVSTGGAATNESSQNNTGPLHRGLLQESLLPQGRSPSSSCLMPPWSAAAYQAVLAKHLHATTAALVSRGILY